MSSPSSWTDDRIEVLTQLWQEGRSASAIARDLGGVTRNAVLGKVHRLGLSGRAAPASPGTRRPRRRAPAAQSWPAAAEAAPIDGTADIVSVGAHACRWPLGDPRAAGFSLCGRRAERGAYCAAHGAIAYRPTPRDHLLKLAGLR